ncbi:MAG: dTDP-4-dehydrorhamnose 3,5-epimerase family protein [Pseudomonadota bacterium]
MTTFVAEPTGLGSVFVLRRKVFRDSRGFFERLYAMDELTALCGIDTPIRHINHSVTKGRGTTRGLHYQVEPDAETKIVTCISGSVLDVAVDMRPDSGTYLQHHAVRLSGESETSFVIPTGFAHGFQCLSDRAELLYFHTAAYAPASERRAHVTDPAIGIDWPMPPSGLSDRDRDTPFLDPDRAP